MKYEEELTQAFKICGFTPRDNQLEDCDLILQAYLDKGKKIAIVSAPTGIGKSVIGAVVAEALHQKISKNKLSAFYLMGQNVLAQQYTNTFIKNDKVKAANFLFLKGASNYECSALDIPGETITAESCAFQIFLKNKNSGIITEHCERCEYKHSRKIKNEVRNLITNYSYYFVDRMYISTFSPNALEKRTLAVFDEAHTINDLFVEHNAIFFSAKRIDGFLKEISEAELPSLNMSVAKKLKEVKQAFKDESLTDDNYIHHLELLAEVYSEIAMAATEAADNNERDVKKYEKFSKMGKKYEGLSCKIADLFIYNYPHIFDYNADSKEASVKAIFIGNMFSQLRHSDFCLFMSATITPDYLKTTMNLDPNEIEFIKLPPVFPREAKKVIFLSPMGLNYNTLKQEATIKTLTQRINSITSHHKQLNENGIVLAPSFDLTEKIAKSLKSIAGINLVVHERGQKLAQVLEFYKYQIKNGKPTVLVSPSLWEGIDLAGELSRWQILVKAPFGSLGDKRVKYIANRYPHLYSLTTLMKLIQGLGRSTRSKDDYSTSYILDAGIQRLWNSDQNIWKDEFSVQHLQEIK
jgi:Rad3-related DNA helicase